MNRLSLTGAKTEEYKLHFRVDTKGVALYNKNSGIPYVSAVGKGGKT